MTGGRLVTAFMMMLACSGVACTAIVLGKLDTISDYGLDDGGPRSSSSSSSGTSGASGNTGADRCSLLAGNSLGAKPAFDNECARCIDRECGDEVTYACGADGGKSKGWFDDMKMCAQNPWVKYPEPDSGDQGGGDWGCAPYIDAGPANTEPVENDATHEAAAQLCITNCMQGKQPSCYLCEISMPRPGSAENGIAYLKDDPCGECLDQNCKDDLIACCSSRVIGLYLQFCSYTFDESYRAKCAMVGDDSQIGDGGSDDLKLPGINSPFDRQCAVRLNACFTSKCGTIPKCQAP